MIAGRHSHYHKALLLLRKRIAQKPRWRRYTPHNESISGVPHRPCDRRFRRDINDYLPSFRSPRPRKTKKKRRRGRGKQGRARLRGNPYVDAYRFYIRSLSSFEGSFSLPPPLFYSPFFSLSTGPAANGIAREFYRRIPRSSPVGRRGDIIVALTVLRGGRARRRGAGPTRSQTIQRRFLSYWRRFRWDEEKESERERRGGRKTEARRVQRPTRR